VPQGEFDDFPLRFRVDAPVHTRDHKRRVLDFQGMETAFPFQAVDAVGVHAEAFVEKIQDVFPEDFPALVSPDAFRIHSDMAWDDFGTRFGFARFSMLCHGSPLQPVHQKFFRLSRRSVTGPSFTSFTAMVS
jgi:hypothetical protein